jgi:ornithine cyclodeaminase
MDDCLMQPAWIRGQHFGIKIANVFLGNPDRGLPSILGAYLLFDGNTGEPLAYIDGTAETLVKTACNSATASRFLSRPETRVMLMMGAGNLAPHLIAAHRAVRPIDKVLIWNRTAASAKALAARLDAADCRVVATEDPASAAGEADLITCATFAAEPILHGAWLKPGVHVDLVGSYTPELRESDDEVMRRATRVFVDARFSTIGVSGDIIAPMAAGILAEEAIVDLFEVAGGQGPGRSSAEDITVFKSGGGGHEDLATAQMLYRLVLDAETR